MIKAILDIFCLLFRFFSFLYKTFLRAGAREKSCHGTQHYIVGLVYLYIHIGTGTLQVNEID